MCISKHHFQTNPPIYLHSFQLNTIRRIQYIRFALAEAWQIIQYVRKVHACTQAQPFLQGQRDSTGREALVTLHPTHIFDIQMHAVSNVRARAC